MTEDATIGEPRRLIRKITDLPTRLFAIGDIHGCFEELNALTAYLKGPEALQPTDLVLFIGDYIDRGPASREVIDHLLGFKEQHANTIFLKGNHEDMLLAYLGLEGRGAEVYLHNGGLEFFRSYGIPPYSDKETLRASLPAPHLDFLSQLEIGIELAEFIFVHAGVNPQKTLDEQTEEDLLWIRRAFLEAPHGLQRTVVFGHTPFEDILLDLPFRIGIDSGLVYGNKLTCVELVQGKLLQVEREETEVRASMLEDRLRVSP